MPGQPTSMCSTGAREARRSGCRPSARTEDGAALAWYGDIDSEPSAEDNDVDRCVQALSDAAVALSPQEFIDRGRAPCDRPGLYSWWVDEEGAEDLSRGLGLEVKPGLIYAGLAGATRWPSGLRSNNTLWLRVMTMHLGGNHEFSTFRRTLGAIVAHSDGVTQIDEDGSDALDARSSTARHGSLRRQGLAWPAGTRCAGRT